MIDVRPVTRADAERWLELRAALWPEEDRAGHAREIESYFAGELFMPVEVLLALDADGGPLGFAELSIRPYAEGCRSERVAYLEGWYVVPGARRSRVGRALVEAAERWAVGQGCTEFASDALIDNDVSAAAHRALGFQEVERIVCFRKDLEPGIRVIEEVRAFWDRVAEDWERQVGTEGDENRRLNSDPVLWAFAGDVKGLRVLDAGCGTGYLTAKLHARGASVTGVDLSERMIEIARATHPTLDFRVDSCSELRTLEPDRFDLIVSNYVLMDTPDLAGALEAFHRVLAPAGVAVVVFSHPCFPQGRATVSESGEEITYRWAFSYFERRRCVDPPWGHFTSEFIWFHRPLSDYWKAFRAAGFEVVDFEEPRFVHGRGDVSASADELTGRRRRPYSVAFKLRKPGRDGEPGAPRRSSGA